MSIATITRRITFFVCQRCGHEWRSRKNQTPRICSRCKSDKWQQKPEKVSA